MKNLRNKIRKVTSLLGILLVLLVVPTSEAKAGNTLTGSNSSSQQMVYNSSPQAVSNKTKTSAAIEVCIEVFSLIIATIILFAGLLGTGTYCICRSADAWK